MMIFLRSILAAILTIFCGFLTFQANSQVLENQIFNESIYSVEAGVWGVEVSDPFIALNGGGKLLVEFDQIGEENSNLSYKIIHCNADWTVSSLRTQEYLNGFSKEIISDFDYSFNTLVPYTHFRLVVPNKNVQFKKSGNYIIQVYDTYDDDNVFFNCRVVVYENLVQVGGRIKAPDRMSVRPTYQEVDFTVHHNGLTMGGGSMKVTASIFRNGDWQNAVYGLEPKFIRPNELIFDYDTNNLFFGGNEYRYFDLRDLSFNSERVYYIDKDATPFAAQLYKDIDRTKQNYTNYRDINGEFVIANAQGTEPDYDADYLNVLFAIPSDFPVREAKLYVNGKLNFSGNDARYLMHYNKNKNQYETRVLVKQGFYNYQYVLEEEGYPLLPFKEGNYWQTENQYHICIYYRGLTDEADRVIGYQSINSVSN